MLTSWRKPRRAGRDRRRAKSNTPKASTRIVAARKNVARAATKADRNRASKNRAKIIGRAREFTRNRASHRLQPRKTNRGPLRNRMKAVHTASVAGIGGVEAAARAINGRLRPNSSVAPVALQKHLPLPPR